MVLLDCLLVRRGQLTKQLGLQAGEHGSPMKILKCESGRTQETWRSYLSQVGASVCVAQHDSVAVQIYGAVVPVMHYCLSLRRAKSSQGEVHL
jgi:hypothetical protein